MSTDHEPAQHHELPSPQVVRRRWIPSFIWLVPLTAVVIGASLVVNAWRTAGPRVTISFQTAEGLEVGKTLVKYRDVTIGRVSAIALSADHNQVRVSADLFRSAQDLLTGDARFWVVRPRIGIGWASGLETLISGAYIAVEAGTAKARQTEFVGLENPPPLSHGVLGKSIVLHAEDVGSLTLGAPVYFRRFEVGHVVDRGLDANGTDARMVLFIDAPYDRFVTRATRFWNASGIDLALGADGLKLRTQSLASVLAGGVAFETVPTAENVGAVPSGAEFTLFKDEASAMAPPDGEPHFVRMRFAQSLRGLSVGAPVEFVGVSIGRVFSIDLDYDADRHSFPVIVTALIYPRRLGKAYEALEQRAASANEDKMARLVGELVSRGLRAQPRTGNLLTGQLYIALDFLPSARPARFSVDARPLEIPTVPGSVQELQQRLTSVVEKIDHVPIAELARHLDEGLVSAQGSLEEIRTDLLPAGTEAFNAAHQTLGTVDQALAEDAPWRDSVDQTLVEARRTLRSVRSLADYLDRHPEALLSGRHAHPTKGERSLSAASEVE
jgi:paraquat-inducible protein B